MKLSATQCAPAAGAAAVLLVYLRTLAPTVSFIDSGELAAVAITLGIAHPTGYPLFTLLGRLWSMVPIPVEEIVRLNIMAAACSAAGVYAFIRLLLLLIGRLIREPLRDAVQGALAVAGGLLLGFSETYWSVAVAVEVYSLHVLFLTLILYLFFRALYAPGRGWWYGFAFVVGLSFTNHLTTILLAPGLLYAYVAFQGWGRETWKNIVRMVAPFMLGLTPYLYLPLRAAQKPVLNWGNPVSWERIVWHVSGKQYRDWFLSSTDALGRQFKYFLSSLPGETGYAGLVLALLGVILLWRRDRRIAITTLLLFVCTVLYSITYDIHDIDSYFLLAYVVMAIWAVIGLVMLTEWAVRRRRLPVHAVVVAVLLAGAIPCVMHFGRADESGNHLVEDYAHAMLGGLAPNALVLSFQWDYWVSPSYYFQLVRGVRPDVVVVDKELLRRSWYFGQLDRRHPWLIRRSAAEVRAFLVELEKFEHERPYDPAIIQARFVEMIRSFINRSMVERPVYVTGEIEPEFTRGLQRVPEGLAFRLYADTLFHPTPVPVFTYRPFPRRGRLEDMVRTLYAQAFAARGVYYFNSGRAQDAEIAAKTALSFDPGFADAHMLLRLIRP